MHWPPELPDSIRDHIEARKFPSYYRAINLLFGYTVVTAALGLAFAWFSIAEEINQGLMVARSAGQNVLAYEDAHPGVHGVLLIFFFDFGFRLVVIRNRAFVPNVRRIHGDQYS